MTSGRHQEFDWLFRGGVARFFPEQWDQLCDAVPLASGDRDILAAYYRQLHDPDPLIRQRAANAWCRWESATPEWPPTTELAEWLADQEEALAFARIVTHYVHHYAWLEDGSLLHSAGTLATIPGILVNGRFDFQAPIANAWDLHRVWPQAELVIVDDAGHGFGSRLLAQGLTSAQMAEQLVIGVVTVNFHMRSIYSKLEVTSRSAATRYALEHHLL